MSVRRTVNRLTGSSFVEGEPKTRAGRRKIAVPEVVIAALKEHREAQVQVRAKAGEKWHEQGIVFCNIYGGFLTPSRLVQYLHGLLKDAGLPHMRFHDLRHSAATFLAAARVDMKVAQERLGHGTIATTADIYTHVSPKMQQDAVEKINDLFKRP